MLMYVQYGVLLASFIANLKTIWYSIVFIDLNSRREEGRVGEGT